MKSFDSNRWVNDDFLSWWQVISLKKKRENDGFRLGIKIGQKDNDNYEFDELMVVE